LSEALSGQYQARVTLKTNRLQRDSLRKCNSI